MLEYFLFFGVSVPCLTYLGCEIAKYLHKSKYYPEAVSKNTVWENCVAISGCSFVALGLASVIIFG